MIDFVALSQAAGMRAIDVKAGQLLARLDQNKCRVLPILASLASWAAGQGHTCLPLAAVEGILRDFGLDDGSWKDISGVRQQLLHSPVVREVGSFAPLILDQDDKLFLYRFHACEQRIAQILAGRAEELLPVDRKQARALLDRLFPSGGEDVDWQRAAAVLSLYKPLVIISGGPGTGKTYTVGRMLALLTQMAGTQLRIALVAPTGKAALRLQTSIQEARTGLFDAPEQVFGLQAQTLHRLLGVQAGRPGFRHNRTNPLHLDLVVVDEASMIDVGLMAALLDALPPRCRIVLLGDRDQLASVEAGNLFADLCGREETGWSNPLADRLAPLLGISSSSLVKPGTNPLADSLVLLRISRRFAPGSGIGALARSINSGGGEPMKQALAQSWPDVEYIDTAVKAQTAALEARLLAFLEPVFRADSPQDALKVLGKSRILCGLREGPRGVEGVNRMAQLHLRKVGSIAPDTRLYPGMPILITRNDYQLGLFNGDTGVLWGDAQGQLCGWFEQDGGGLRSFSLPRLPAWQPSYAMTVHKSQGSEFARVLLLLPQDDAPVLSRELLYTGITRAKRQLLVAGPRELLLRTASRRVIRYSGLARKIGDLEQSKANESQSAALPVNNPCNNAQE